MKDPRSRPYYLKEAEKKRTWIQKNPRLFVYVATSSLLLAFFSRPIFDIFFRDYTNLQPIPVEETRKKWKL
jgi:hypothetical protein